jgi:DNA-binding NtrC family response regulator
VSERILIVDDDPVQRRLLEGVVTRLGYQASVVEDGLAALTFMEGGGAASVVILDLTMPGLDGLGVLKAMAERGIDLPVIVQTARGGIDTVVQAMRHGAFDFVVKPASPEKLNAAISSALKVEARETKARRSGATRDGAASFDDLITSSRSMDRVLTLARKAAASTIPILIEGETGVGKELVARAIQGSGPRRAKPFVTVNCGAIPENLVETILFGHEKGAFTGATDKHTGKFVEANGGTLFLDEVGDLPLDVQVKLLRAIQEGEVDPVGGRASVKVDIRLISATHRDLLQLVKEGRFREDLFYRLNVFPIHVPPLRERRGDVPGLAAHFLAKFSAAEAQGKVKRIASRAMAMLEAYDWPGNIRQLENAVFRATVLCDGDTLLEQDFPQIQAQVEGIVDFDRVDPEPRYAEPERPVQAVREPEPTGDEVFGTTSSVSAAAPASGLLKAVDDSGDMRALAEVELDMIRMAIAHYDGQMSEVARRLGIGRSTLYRKLKEYGIDPGSDRLSDAEPGERRLAS